MIDHPNPDPTVTYFIVVHGIGQQRHNETVLNVINRMAEVRTAENAQLALEKAGLLKAESPARKKFKKALRKVRNRQNIEVVSLGMLASQTGTPEVEKNGKLSFKHCRTWSEFEGISAQKRSEAGDPFFEGKLAFEGENLRFVDFTWSDLLEKHFSQTGQSLGTWTKSLIGRYSINMHGTDPDSGWIKPLLESLAETMQFVENLLGWRWSSLKKTIFDSYLGDVQIYGENLRVRGEAVRRFHNLMDKLEWAHFRQFIFTPEEEEKALAFFLNTQDIDSDEKPTAAHLNAFEEHLKVRYREGERAKVKPNYVILAHSLGTVLSMDALLYAFSRRDLQSPYNRDRFVNLPFAGYERPTDPFTSGGFVGDRWISNVSSFVTLGSPIDKYLTLWWNNYHYLDALPNTANPDGWEPDREALKAVFDLPEAPFIRHYNYCDEQDPVGHNLDRFSSKAIYSQLFCQENEDLPFPNKEDHVFSRYAWTGLAHEKYWSDVYLFRRILQLTVDLPAGTAKKEELEDGSRLDQFWTYWVVILLVYLFPPLAGACTSAALFGWFWTVYLESGFSSAFVPLIFTFSSIYLFRKIIHMSITWRQVVKSKNRGEKANYRKQNRARVFKYILVPAITITLLTLSGLQLLALLAERTQWGNPVIPYEKQSVLYVLPILAAALPLLVFFLRKKIAHIPPRVNSLLPDLLSSVVFFGSGLLVYRLFLISFDNASWSFLYPWNHSMPSWVGLLLSFGFLSWLFTVFDFVLMRNRFKNLERQSQQFVKQKQYFKKSKK
ncbi:MAG: hypothetical protein ACFB10_16865 [Salibacteraceae bacterium]|mgnify:CR=1 FL=1